MSDLSDLAGKLDSCGASPDDHKREPRTTQQRIVLEFGRLKGPEDATADREGIFNRL